MDYPTSGSIGLFPGLLSNRKQSRNGLVVGDGQGSTDRSTTEKWFSTFLFN